MEAVVCGRRLRSWLQPGKLAESKAVKVRAVRQIIEGMGPVIATPDEARGILKLTGRAKVGFRLSSCGLFRGQLPDGAHLDAANARGGDLRRQLDCFV